MHLYIRADADSRIGTGHVMRCIALAQAWQDRGAKVAFLCHCESEALHRRIIDEGFDFIAVGNSHPDPSDLRQTLKELSVVGHQPSANCWLVLDGYHFTPEYQKAIRDAGIRLLVIDDLNHLSHYYADILLNQNIHAPDLKYQCDEDTVLLLGTRYVLLRREFLRYRSFRRQIPRKAKNILVSLGGGDLDNVTLKAIQALKYIEDPEIEARVVVGPVNHNTEKLRKEIIHSPFAIRLLPNVNNMPELMAWADLAISGGGSTCWELAFMGLPSLVAILAENQVELAVRLETKHAAVNIGWFHMFSSGQLFAKIDALMNDRNLRSSISDNASSLIDGEGIARVSDAMVGGQITLRRATLDDCRLVWQWSNEKETRQASFSQGLISWEEHVQWFKDKLEDRDHFFFIASNGKKNPLGQLRFSVEEKKAVVSLSIAAESRNLGYGSEILRIGARKLFHETKVDEIIAFVKDENQISLRTFQRAGFKKTKESITHGVKSYKLVLIRAELI